MPHVVSVNPPPAAATAWSPADLPVGIPRIVVGIDGSPGARWAVDECARLAQRLGAAVIGVHATLSSDRRRPSPQDIDAWCAPLRRHNVVFAALVVDDDAMPVLCEVADLVGADLVVVGASRRSELGEFVFGGVAFELAHHGNRPVLIVPPPRRPPVRPPPT